MTVHLQSATQARGDQRVALVFNDAAGLLDPLPKEKRSEAQQTAKLRDFRGNAGQTLLLPFGAKQWLLVGLGDKAALTRPAFCTAVAKGLVELRAAGASQVELLLPEGLPWPIEEAARYAGEALLMGGYTFTTYRTRDVGSKDAPTSAAKPPRKDASQKAAQGAAVTVTVTSAGPKAAIGRGLAAAEELGQGIRLTRDLINHPAGVAHTDYMAEQAQGVAKAVGARFKRIRGEELLREGYAAIHAVGAAAEHPAQLVVLEHGRRSKGKPTVALVGKGVTFDTGGLDLKPSSGMALMKKDMGGAATVLGAFRAIAGLKLPLHVVCVLGLAENAVDSKSYRPGDILKTKQGLTVEVTNTDAEGRIVLADAMALARTYKPDYMVDFATLTGACRIALGRDLMGLFCEHEGLRSALEAAAAATGDHVWRLPLWAPYRDKLDSPVADLVNSAAGGMAGAVTAALFLKEFAGDVAWAHLDCYAWSDGDSPLFPPGGSGVGVRLCVDLMSRLLQEGGQSA